MRLDVLMRLGRILNQKYQKYQIYMVRGGHIVMRVGFLMAVPSLLCRPLLCQGRIELRRHTFTAHRVPCFEQFLCHPHTRACRALSQREALRLMRRRDLEESTPENA